MTDERRWHGIRVQNLIVIITILSLLSIGVTAATFSTPVSSNADGAVVTEPGGPSLNMTLNTDVSNESGAVNDTAVQWVTADGTMVVVSDKRTNTTVTQIEGTYTQTQGLDTNGTELHLDPSDKQTIVVTGGLESVDWRDVSGIAVGDGTTDFRYQADSEGTITIGGLPANDDFAAETAGGTPLADVETDGSGRATITLPSRTQTDVRLVEDPEPVITSAAPADSADLEAANTTLEATVEDGTFASGSETLTVEFYLNGDSVATETLNSNGTASVDVEPPLSETSTWNVTVTDSYQQTETLPDRTFRTPAELKIYEEANPQQLVDGQNVNLSVRFFPIQRDSGEVVTREATDGVVNLTGLPADERFVVTINANESANYTYRRIVVDSLYETNRVYLLSENDTYSQIVFDLQDPTGSFPPSETILYIEKPIEINNETRYQTIAGDTFGASSSFPALLQEDERYRLRVATADGQNERILGFYSVYGNARETLLTQRIEPSADNRTTGVVYGGLEESDSGQSQLAVRFLGGTNDTTVEYYVTDENGDVVVPNTTTTASSFAHIYPVNESGQYNVTYEIDQNGETRTGSFVAGTISEIAERFNIDAQVLSLISWVAILSALGLVVIVDPKLAPAAGTGMASLLTIIGTVAIPMPMLGISGAISVLTLFGGRQ